MGSCSGKRKRIHVGSDGNSSCLRPEPCRPTMSGIFFRRSKEIFSTYVPVHPNRFVDLTSLGTLPGYPNLRLLDSCRGLLLFDQCDETKPMIVCNPASKTWMSIKKFTSTRPCIGLKLGLDPHSNYSAFRIVMALVADRGIELVVFNSITRSYHRRRVTMEVAPGTGWGERLFTLARDYLYVHAGSGELLRLDATEKVRISLPKVGFGGCYEVFGESGGSAHYAVCHESMLIVWVWDSEERDWVLKQAASTEALIGQHGGKVGHQPGFPAVSVMPLAFHPDLDVVFLQVDWKIYSFDPASDGFEEVAGEQGPNPEGERYLVYPYTNCFIDVPEEYIPTPDFTKIMS